MEPAPGEPAQVIDIHGVFDFHFTLRQFRDLSPVRASLANSGRGLTGDETSLKRLFAFDFGSGRL